MMPVTTISCAPPGVFIHGEISAEGTDVVMLPTGPPDGIVRAGAQIQLITPATRPSDPPGALLMPLSWPGVVQVAFTYGTAWRPGPVLTEWIKAELLARTEWADRELPYVPPAGLTAYPWQQDGARMVLAHGVFFEDDPGTGKTITALLGLANREAAGTPVRPIVAVVPASTVDQWVEAAQAWCPHWRSVAWRGTPAQRVALAGTADFYVTSYELCGRDAGADAEATGKAPLLAVAPRSVIADEAHFIKNTNALRSTATRRLARTAEVFLPLSGTPITHDASDMFNALGALEPAAFPNFDRYDARYIQRITDKEGRQVVTLNQFREPEFRTALMGRTRRIAKADALPFLPPKVYTVRTVVLPPKWRRAYDDIQAKMLADLPESGQLRVPDMLAQITRLSQLASSAADVESHWEVDETTGEAKERQTVTLRAPSWKVDALLEVMAERRGHPLVCFAVSRQLINIAGLAASEAGFRVGYIVGGQTPSVRTAQRESFQRGELDVICVTVDSGGTGLNLMTGDCAVFLQRPWSIVGALQAEDRIHRIGSEQHQQIDIIDIIAENTIDTRVRSVLRGKAGNLAELLLDRRIATQLLGGGSITRIKAKKAIA